MDKTTMQKNKTIAYELNQLHNKVLIHIEDRMSVEGYVYADTYRGWVNEYNKIVAKYNNLTGGCLSVRTVQEYELSSTHKTVRTDVARAFAQSIKELANKVDSDIQTEQNKVAPIPAHQMRVCFKTGVRGCPLSPPEKKKRVFVAMPFSDDYRDSYEYGIKLILDQLSIEHYRADDEISNKDIMCKICREIQSCGKVIANISELNPNVMLELGLAYGLGKEVIVIKDKKTASISDLGSIEYIEYSHAGELQQKLLRLLQ